MPNKSLFQPKSENKKLLVITVKIVNHFAIGVNVKQPPGMTDKQEDITIH